MEDLVSNFSIVVRKSERRLQVVRGAGVDWTRGCIALDDEEMKAFFGLVEIGTPVFIES